MKFWLTWALSFAFTLFVVFVVFCYPSGAGKERTKIARCLSNVKQQALAVIIYEDDFDDRYPRGDRWMDVTKEYLKAEDMRHCPLVPKGACGYAFNSSLSLTKTPKDVEKVVLIYDSTTSRRNASDRFSSLPRPGRHEGKDNIAFADGHAKALMAVANAP